VVKGRGLSQGRDVAKESSRRPTDGTQGGAIVVKAHIEPIRQTVTVQCDPGRAFDLFTNQIGTWWPIDSYSRAVSEFHHEDVKVAELVFQARMGGSILERLTDGRILPWAEVIGWQPPHRLLLSWRPHSAPEPPTEVDVTFAQREGGTLVEIEHRGWERLSERFREGLYEVYGRGWPTTLQCFAVVADRASAKD
jgi:uncharacterized protein YndB with AHSA1/START domain